MPAVATPVPIRPDTTIRDLARWPLLAELGPNTAIVYLRLVAASGERGRKMHVYNRDLHPVARTAIRCLHELEDTKLVRVTHAKTADGLTRTIELL